MKTYLGCVSSGIVVASMVAMHLGCGGATSSSISSPTCGAEQECYVTRANGVCAVDPDEQCNATGEWVCGPGGVLGTGCLSDGGILPAPVDAGTDANDYTCGDYAPECFAESDGGCVGSPIYPSCVNGVVQCPSGTIDSTECPVTTGYLACMDAEGAIDPSLKSCQNDTDCVIESEQTDCCGTRLYVGVSTSNASLLSTCLSAWDAHFPGCACAGGGTKTEDGKTPSPNADGGGAAVHCTDFTTGGGICETYTP